MELLCFQKRARVLGDFRITTGVMGLVGRRKASFIYSFPDPGAQSISLLWNDALLERQPTHLFVVIGM